MSFYEEYFLTILKHMQTETCNWMQFLICNICSWREFMISRVWWPVFSIEPILYEMLIDHIRVLWPQILTGLLGCNHASLARLCLVRKRGAQVSPSLTHCDALCLKPRPEGDGKSSYKWGQDDRSKSQILSNLSNLTIFTNSVKNSFT